MKEEDVESMSQIFDEYGIKVSEDLIKKITSDFLDHVSAMADMYHMSLGGYKEPECSNCKRLENETERLNHDIDVYRDSVKKRRNAIHVYIENDEVKYDFV